MIHATDASDLLASHFQGSDLDRVLGTGITQRITSIRRRRQDERVQKILTAAGSGDLSELKSLLKVLNPHQFWLTSTKKGG